MERIIRCFTFVSVFIMLITAFLASCFVAAAKAEANISGKIPEIAGETDVFYEKVPLYCEFKVNF